MTRATKTHPQAGKSGSRSRAAIKTDESARDASPVAYDRKTVVASLTARKPGRPPHPAGTVRTERLDVRWTSFERAHLREQCEREGVSPAVWLRALALGDLARLARQRGQYDVARELERGIE